MLRFQEDDPKGGGANTLQAFASVHGTVHNHFNQERHLVSRETYKQRRSAALAEWRAARGISPARVWASCVHPETSCPMPDSSAT